MLTRRGWSMLGSAAGLLIAGRLLGVVELVVLATAAFVVVVGAVVMAATGTAEIAATRTLHPARVHAGSPARVDLTLVNVGRRRTGLLGLADNFAGGRRRAEFLVPSLHPGETGRAAYRLPTSRRGVYEVGPMELSRADPFGLARVRHQIAGVDELTVWPAIDRVVALPPTARHDPLAGRTAATRSPTGDEFFALREYEVGDDLRRVHWRSTARTGELMIRQQEMPWQSRVTVLLDTRVGTHSGESFERAVEAAASVVTALASRRCVLRFMTTGGLDIGFGTGHQRFERVMEHLATVRVDATDHFDGTMARLRHEPGQGSIVAIVAGTPPSELSLLGRLRVQYGHVVVVALLPSAYGGPETVPFEIPDPVVPGAVVVAVTASNPFAQAWDHAMSRWPTGVSLRS